MFRHVSFFVSGASVPCLQQIADQTRNRKEKRDYESGDTEGTLRERASGPVQCREPTSQSVAEDGQRCFIRRCFPSCGQTRLSSSSYIAQCFAIFSSLLICRTSLRIT